MVGGDLGHGLNCIGELCWVHKPADIAHDYVKERFEQSRVFYFVSLLDILKVYGLAQIGEIFFFKQFVIFQYAFGKSTKHEIFAEHGMTVTSTSLERCKFSKGKWTYLYDLPSSAKFGGDVCGEHPRVGACHIDIYILGGPQSVQDPMEVDKHPLTVMKRRRRGESWTRCCSPAGAGGGRYLRVQRPSSVSYQQPLGRRSRDFAA